MHCGTVLAQPTVAYQPQAAMQAPAMPMAAPYVQPRKKAGLMGVIVGVVILAAVVFGLNAAGVLQLQAKNTVPKALQAEGSDNRLSALDAQGSNTTPETLSAQGSNSAPSVLDAQGASGGPVLGSDVSKKSMPDDVRRWLEHLERIEKRRIAMTEEQLAAAMVQMTELSLGGSMSDIQKLLDDGETTQENIDTARRAVNTFEGNRRKWTALNEDFLSVAPPAECIPLRNEYTTVLSETGSMILEICKAVEDADTDRQGALTTLMRMQGKSDARIGRPARGSDRKLGEICDKYDTSKWFSIASDVGGGLMGKMGGIGF